MKQLIFILTDFQDLRFSGLKLELARRMLRVSVSGIAVSGHFPAGAILRVGGCYENQKKSGKKGLQQHIKTTSVRSLNCDFPE
jgi:hypothetical protein